MHGLNPVWRPQEHHFVKNDLAFPDLFLTGMLFSTPKAHLASSDEKYIDFFVQRFQIIRKLGIINLCLPKKLFKGSGHYW